MTTLREQAQALLSQTYVQTADEILEQWIHDLLETSTTFNNGTYTVLYEPMSYRDNDGGRVLAHLVEIDQEERVVRTSRYYSRAWAYWNFIDATDKDDFEVANAAIEIEERNYIDKTIESSEEALVVINSGSIPHDNAYWQALVVRTAYNAITNVEEFANMVRSGNHTQAEVQRMIDLAVGAVLSNPDFQLTGLETLAA